MHLPLALQPVFPVLAGSYCPCSQSFDRLCFRHRNSLHSGHPLSRECQLCACPFCAPGSYGLNAWSNCLRILPDRLPLVLRHGLADGESLVNLGTYSDTDSAPSSVLPVRTGSFTPVTGSTSCQPCGAGYYCPNGTKEMDCPIDHYCPPLSTYCHTMSTPLYLSSQS
jgi:hypothetical protein